MTQATQAEKKETKGAQVAEHVLLMSVKDISADHTWNARSGRWWEDKEITPPAPANGASETDAPPKKPRKEKVSEHGGFDKFEASILETGTNTEPIICRQPSKPGGKPRLVCGFRRHMAVTELAEAADYKGPTLAQQGMVRVVVREMTEQQARVLNALENTARDDLSGPDLCWVVGNLVKEHDLNDSAIAARLGKSQGYISKLHRIHDALAPEVLKMWRASTIKVTIDNIEHDVIMTTKKGSTSIPTAEEQKDYFQRVVEGKGGKQSSARGPDAWIDTKQGEAEELGKLLGTLKAAGLIEVLEKDTRILVFTIVKLPKKFDDLNPAKKGKIEKAMLASFDAGVEAGLAAAEDKGDEDDEDDDEDEDDQD